MWKLSLWFAVLGSLIAVLGSGVGDIAPGRDSKDVFDGGSSLTVRFYGPDWEQLWQIAVVGAVLGALIGVVLHLAGVRVAAGTGNRFGRVVSAGLVGIAVGLAPILAMVLDAVNAWQPGYSVAVEPVSLLTTYAVCAGLAYCAALLLVWSILRVTGDDFGPGTTKRAAVLLPVGGIAATACGVGTAWLYDFTTRPYVVVSSTLVVMLVLSATLVAARVWAVGGNTPRSATGDAPTGSV
ncbi:MULTISPECIES: hypothetical protein [Nocardiaceae]|uniref:hypothetical protein n=1 Tax=Nocardiaceae TaxID=85025 RepID=UPI000366B9CF|nr:MULTISPECIES: hypothetical protein [Rhodococcus]OZD17810.1 hypothetical protein CH280_08300 [Rhodococcus sp. 06-156-4C]OZD21388.1 hypothetical protein CH248_09725 [Rhodococcus sp. 06-156-4a]OZD24065.1 hypothetical protein CH247_29285 [Rhodococcus sp. 06-156-3b]OZD25238.1 hypothetical protein CH253_04320 [Rhodococcus sp. 06-156-3C]OZD40182.1 hypothetical protein CH284_04045 [Rhodococcus sp. 06-156-3]